MRSQTRSRQARNWVIYEPPHRWPSLLSSCSIHCRTSAYSQHSLLDRDPRTNQGDPHASPFGKHLRPFISTVLLAQSDQQAFCLNFGHHKITKSWLQVFEHKSHFCFSTPTTSTFCRLYNEATTRLPSSCRDGSS